MTTTLDNSLFVKRHSRQNGKVVFPSSLFDFGATKADEEPKAEPDAGAPAAEEVYEPLSIEAAGPAGPVVKIEGADNEL